MKFEKYNERIENLGYSHPKIKEIHDMLKGKSNFQNHFAVEGVWLLEYLNKSPIIIDRIVFARDYLNNERTLDLLEELFNRDLEIIEVSKKVFEKISTVDGPDGLIIEGHFPAYDLEKILKKGNNQIVVLDGLETSGNIGTIFRTAEGLDVRAIFITNKRAKITNSKTIKSSMGGLLFVPFFEWESVEKCQEWLLKHNFEIFLTDTRAKQYYYQASYQGNVALIAGNERFGISKEWYQKSPHLIAIPMQNKCDSLNVSVATTIMMCEVAMQQIYQIKNR